MLCSLSIRAEWAGTATLHPTWGLIVARAEPARTCHLLLYVNNPTTPGPRARSVPEASSPGDAVIDQAELSLDS